jgi:transposase
VNAFPGPRSVLIMNNAQIHRSESLQQMCNDRAVVLIYLPPYSPDFNPIEQSFNQIKMWMRKNRGYLQDFEEFFDWALEQFNITGNPGSHFWICGYTNRDPGSVGGQRT